MSLAVPTDEEKDNVFLASRYGDVEDIEQFVIKFGPDPLNDIRDDRGNSVLHMVCANGHIDALDYLLKIVSPSLLSAQNEAKSTALHWAALNSHLEVAQKLVKCPGGPGVDLIDMKNSVGRSPLGEAENIGWEEGAKWFVGVMKLDDGEKSEGDVKPEEGIESIEVEIQDAEGQMAKMKIASAAPADLPK